MSPGRRSIAIRAATSAAVDAERSGKTSTPGRSLAAAQSSGTPLERAATETTTTRPPAGRLMTAGRRASPRSHPAPAVWRPARRSVWSVWSVSASPSYPKSRTWLLASTQASIAAACETYVGGVHTVVDLLATPGPVTHRDARLQIDDASIRGDSVSSRRASPQIHASPAGRGIWPLTASASFTYRRASRMQRCQGPGRPDARGSDRLPVRSSRRRRGTASPSRRTVAAVWAPHRARCACTEGRQESAVRQPSRSGYSSAEASGLSAMNFMLVTFPCTAARSSVEGAGVNASPGQQAMACSSAGEKGW